MKSSMIVLFLVLAPAVYGRCVVEILDNNDEPLGHVFQGDSCTEPKARCEQTLRRLNNSQAKCEITLDIGSRTSPTQN